MKKRLLDFRDRVNDNGILMYSAMLLLQASLIILKVCNAVTWSWWLILLPAIVLGITFVGCFALLEYFLYKLTD